MLLSIVNKDCKILSWVSFKGMGDDNFSRQCLSTVEAFDLCHFSENKLFVFSGNTLYAVYMGAYSELHRKNLQ